MGSEAFQVNFGAQGGKKDFADLKAFLAWLNEEEKNWEWLHSKHLPQLYREVTKSLGRHFDYQTSPPHHYQSVFTELRRPVQDAEQRQHEHRQRQQQLPKDDPQRGAEFDPKPYALQIQERVKKYYCDGKTLLSTDPRAIYVAGLKDTDPAAATFALAYFLRLEIPYPSHEGLRGAMLAWQFENGRTDTIQPERKALEGLRDEWQRKFDSVKEGMLSETAENAKLKTEYARFLAEHREATDKQLADQRTAWEATVQQLHEKFTTGAPVKHWNDRAKEHSRGAKWWGFLSVVSLLAVLISLRPYVTELHTIKDKPDYSYLAGLILIGALGVWFVRMVFKLFINQIHLHNDAKARVAMVKTYLSLMAERDAQIGKEDRHLVLTALFRPAPTSTGKEPSLPAAAWDQVTSPKV
jgi:hypothetical protein